MWTKGRLSLLITVGVAFVAPLRAESLQQGEIEGAKFAIATPSESTKWNGNLLLIAHGYRPETAPLVADLFPNQLAYATLLREGWIVAKTSYRRNGIIVEDAIDDLNNLKTFIANRHGPLRRVIVEGESMGGTIATLIAERGVTGYHGLIAIGAALDLRENEGAPGVSLEPQTPLLFVANRSEIEGPAAYVRTAAASRVPGITPPGLFRIDRDGHVNVNQAERLFAIRAMEAWLSHGPTSLPSSPLKGQSFDATHPATPNPSQVSIDADSRGLVAQVTEVSAIYGNVWLNLQPSDLEVIGLNPGLWFELKVHGQTYRTRYGKDFSSVEKGQWVIFPNADGFFWLSRNWGNAAETAGLTLGDEVHLRRYDSAP